MIHPARVLVAAVEHHDRAARLPRRRRPVAIEERDAVVRVERMLGGGARALRRAQSSGGVNRSFIATRSASRRSHAAAHAHDDVAADQQRERRHEPEGDVGKRASEADVEPERAEHERAIALAHRAVEAPGRAHHRAERAGHFRHARRDDHEPDRPRAERRDEARTADRARRRRRRRRAR